MKTRSKRPSRQAEYVKAYRARKALLDPDFRRRDRYPREYGITLDQYEATLAEQHGLCAICGQPETRVTKGTLDTLSVDHDHETGKVRGLLCGRCNKALGVFRDDTALLAAAILYLEEGKR